MNSKAPSDLKIIISGILGLFFIMMIIAVGAIIIPIGVVGYGGYRLLKFANTPAPPAPPPEPQSMDALQWTKAAFARWDGFVPPYEVFLRMNETFLEDPCAWRAFDAIMNEIPKELRRTDPQLYDDHFNPQPHLTIPLYEILNRNTAQDVIEAFFDDRMTHYKLCETFNRNLEKAKNIQPEKHPGSMKQIVDTYFAGTPLYPVFHAQIPWQIPSEEFGSHGFIVAPSKHGKSQLLGTFIHRFLTEEPKTGIIVLDPHGDLFKELKGKTPPDRTIIIDTTDNPPPLNFFDFRGTSDVEVQMSFSYLLSSLSEMTPKQLGIAPFLLAMMQAADDATLSTLVDLLTEQPKTWEQSDFAKYLPKLDDDSAKFFRNQFLGANKMAETKNAMSWKVASALKSSPAFKAMFGNKENTLDAFQAMQDQKIILIKGTKLSLSGNANLGVFMQIMVAKFLMGAFKRDELPKHQRPLCLIFADEAKYIFNDQTEEILTETRKYGLGFMAATQMLDQMPPKVKAAFFGSSAIRISGPIRDENATNLAKDMYTTPEFIRSCTRTATEAEWAVYVMGHQDHAIKVTVPYFALHGLPDLGLPEKLNPPKPCPFKERDLIQVTLGGTDQYKDGVRIRKIYPDDEILFVDGAEAGIPFKDCYHYKPKPDNPPPVSPQPSRPPRYRHTPP